MNIDYSFEKVEQVREEKIWSTAGKGARSRESCFIFFLFLPKNRRHLSKFPGKRKRILVERESLRCRRGGGKLMEGAGQAMSKTVHPLHLEGGVCCRGWGCVCAARTLQAYKACTSDIIDACQFLRLFLLLKLSCKTGGKS